MTARIFTIPPELSFVDELAKGLSPEVLEDPLRGGELTIFLSTRRACRHLRDAFLRLSQGRAALLPRLLPLGDAQDDDLYFAADSILPDLKPAIPPLRRLLLLAKLVQAKDKSLSLDRAAALAESLARLLDEVQTVEATFDDLSRIVPDSLAAHWQETLRFLEIVTDVWPRLLEQEGCLDPIKRRNMILRARAEMWEKHPPAHGVMIAGSTGSVPAVARLMTAVAHLPKGRVILPGLDTALDETAWQAVAESHPQYGMKLWLDMVGQNRRDVQNWTGSSRSISPPNQRVRLLQESMRPAQVTHAWLDLDRALLTREAVKNLSRLEVDSQQTEAEAIALYMRGALEKPEKTVSLITPDRALATRVSNALRRWGIEADDSAGQSLSSRPVGSFFAALLEAADPMTSPVSYLSLLKHPLTQAGVSSETCRLYARRAEILVWRGVRLAQGWNGAAHALKLLAEEKKQSSCKEIASWMQNIAQSFAPLVESWNKPREMVAWLDDLLQLAETLATGSENQDLKKNQNLNLNQNLNTNISPEETGPANLWRGTEGSEAARFFVQLRQSASDFPQMTGAEFKRLFLFLLARVTLRVPTGQHPRLTILGPLEARLWHADYIILGGLNEGVWPQTLSVDPWMSRPMKHAFGLPLPERRIGLSAHDFLQQAAGPCVLMTRARRVDGTPTVPSRFLLQIEVVLRALGLHDDTKDALACDQPWGVWAKKIDAPPLAEISPCPRPAPCPPLTARPQDIWVTDVALWQKNPYAFYAKRILKLRKLDPIDDDVSGADFGNIIHGILENFLIRTRENWPQDPLAMLLDEGHKQFRRYEDRPQVVTFWLPRFQKIAVWFSEQETLRRALGYKNIAVEAEGKLEGIAENLCLHGRADRLDKRPDGTLEVIDYKTSTKVPPKTEISLGVEPQLPLLASMAEEGGFKDIPPMQVSAMSYWHLRGSESDDIITIDKDAEDLIAKSVMGFAELVTAFADPASVYAPVPRRRYAPAYDDYAHLARLAEWQRS